MISPSGAAPAERATSSSSGDTAETRGEEMSCDKNRGVSGCVVLADKAVIQCYAEDSRNPLRHKHLLVTHHLLAHLHLRLSRICFNY